MKDIVLVYDDTVNVNNRIKTIIGNKSFGNMVLKRKKQYERIEELTKTVKSNIIFKKINSKEEFKTIANYPNDTIFFHLLSNAAIINVDEFITILEKLKYINETTVIKYNENTIGAIFDNKENYIQAIDEYENITNLNFLKNNIIETNAFVDLSDYNNLLMYISSGFDARYFNSIQGDNYTVIKKSTDKKKMKMEYSYYWLLPEEMKSWMVMPYDYKEEKDYASYKMERMPMTDIAIRWTHEAIDVEEFKKIMDKIFYFFSIRKSREISKEDYIKSLDELYINKLDKRIENLKELEEYKKIEKLIQSGTKYNSIDEMNIKICIMNQKYK